MITGYLSTFDIISVTKAKVTRKCHILWVWKTKELKETKLTQFASFSGLADNLQKEKIQQTLSLCITHVFFRQIWRIQWGWGMRVSPNVNDCVVQVILKFTNKNVRQFIVSSSIIQYFQSQNLKVDKEGNFNLFALIIKIERPSKWVLLDFRI